MQKNVLICKIVPQKGIHAELYTKATNENIAQHPLFNYLCKNNQTTQ